MSRIIFQNSYAIIIPSYTDTEYHKHNMLHMFVGSENSNIHLCGQQYSGSIIFTKENIVHKSPDGDNGFFLLIDPTSDISENIQKIYLNSQNGYATNIEIDWSNILKQTDKEIIEYTENLMNEILIKNTIHKIQDERISELLKDISSYQYLGRRVTDIAMEKHYSESWLVHLFKREAGISLKNYLIIRQFEYVWKLVLAGKTTTYAALEAGFSNLSHFSAICKQMTGISLSEALRRKADF